MRHRTPRPPSRERAPPPRTHSRERALPRCAPREPPGSGSVGSVGWAGAERSGAIRSGAARSGLSAAGRAASAAQNKGAGGACDLRATAHDVTGSRGPGSCSSAAPPGDGPAAGGPQRRGRSRGQTAGTGEPRRLQRWTAAVSVAASSCHRRPFAGAGSTPPRCRCRGEHSPRTPQVYPTHPAPGAGKSLRCIGARRHLPAGQSLVPALGSPTEALQQEPAPRLKTTPCLGVGVQPT